MDKQDSSLANDIQELINKSIEVNKMFLSETSKLVRGVTTPGEKKTPNIFQANFLTEAFSAYAKMNIQHMKNMLDLGVSLVQKANTQQTTEPSDNTETPTETPVPSFVLKGDVEAGNKISLNFSLDNIKQETVLCILVNTPYNFQTDALIQENFTTIFSPQSFMLNTGEQKRINIDIDVPATANPGIYISNVQVRGFEPAYFSILLTVIEAENKTFDNGRKKSRRSPQ
ncbi:MAG: hypothetical protein ABJA35_01765 [Parafilimonas sp.]